MKEAEKMPQNVAQCDTSASRGLRILVVEDFVESARSLAQLLGLFGHEVEVAFDGPAALAVAHNMYPDVVILDIGLPGMSGCDVARTLMAASNGKRPFFIMVSGRSDKEAIGQSAEVGADLHLLKPLDPHQLEFILRRFQQVIH